MDEIQIVTVKLLAERGHRVTTSFRPSLDHQYEGDAIEIIDLDTMETWPYELHHTPEDGDGVPHDSYIAAWATPGAPGVDPRIGELLTTGRLATAIDAILAHRNGHTL